MDISFYKSPVGILKIISEDNSLVYLQLVKKAEKPSAETVFIKETKSQLDEYFSGKIRTFDIKINPKGTEFQKTVWRELLKIPYGETKSYSEIAEKIGNKNAQRAVGNACNKNPVMIIIPCHRVITKIGKSGGFACGCGIKQKLLDTEKYFYFL